MRCALKFDEKVSLSVQKLSAWGEMQSLDEDPEYREEDIEDEKMAEWFRGYKYAIDDVCTDLENAVEEGIITKEALEELESYFSGQVCTALFSILDEEVNNE